LVYGREQNIEHGFRAVWIRKLNDVTLNLITLVHQEYVASGKLRSPHDHGIRGRANDPQVRLSLQAYLTAREVQVPSSLDGDIQLDLDPA
jgi:hypothetical protein